MKEWLDKHNIPYQRTDLKKNLFRLIQQQNSKPKYLTDVSAAELGMFFGFLLHTVSLTQLSSHGQLSKDMWPKTKKFILTEVQRLVPKAIESVTTKMWTSFVKHVIEIELEYRKKVEEVIEEFISHIDEEDDIDDDDVEMDDDDRQLIELELARLP